VQHPCLYNVDSNEIPDYPERTIRPCLAATHVPEKDSISSVVHSDPQQPCQVQYCSHSDTHPSSGWPYEVVRSLHGSGVHVCFKLHPKQEQDKQNLGLNGLVYWQCPNYLHTITNR
jgi:hypothetical protein